MTAALAEAGLVDAAHLADLTAVLGAEVVAPMIVSLVADLTATPARIAALIDAGEGDAARAAAHGLRGAALGIGCTCVAALAGRIENGPLDAANGAELIALGRRTIAALRDHADPPAPFA